MAGPLTRQGWPTMAGLYEPSALVPAGSVSSSALDAEADSSFSLSYVDEERERAARSSCAARARAGSAAMASADSVLPDGGAMQSWMAVERVLERGE